MPYSGFADPDLISDEFSGFYQRKSATMVMFTTGISIFATISAIFVFVFGIIGNNRRNWMKMSAKECHKRYCDITINSLIRKWSSLTVVLTHQKRRKWFKCDRLYRTERRRTFQQNIKSSLLSSDHTRVVPTGGRDISLLVYPDTTDTLLLCCREWGIPLPKTDVYSWWVYVQRKEHLITDRVNINTPSELQISANEMDHIVMFIYGQIESTDR